MNYFPPGLKKFSLLFSFLLLTLVANLPGYAQPQIKDSLAGANRLILSFDKDWKFARYNVLRAETPEFDDSAWRAVDLPHDWSIEDLPPPPAQSKPRIIGPFDGNAIGGTATGFTVGGEGWYRKRFRLQTEVNGRVEILFEGIYMNSDVWVNGHHLGAHPNGYTPFAYELTPHLSGAENVLAVRVRNLGKN